MNRRSRSLALAALLTLSAAQCLGQPSATPAVKGFEDSPVTVTFAGTSTLLFEDGVTKVLVDGFFSRPSKLRVALSEIRTDPCRVEHALDQLRVVKLDVIAVAHSHYDHAMDAAKVASCTGAIVFGSASTLMTTVEGYPVQQYIHGVARDYGDFRVTPFKSLHSPMFSLLKDLGETIDGRLVQPVHASAYKEGGSYDLLIEHVQKGKEKERVLRLLVTPSASVDPHVSPNAADVVFLGVGALARQPKSARMNYYNHSVDARRTQVVIPIHWDDFSEPLSEGLESMQWPFDDADAGLSFVRKMTKAAGKHYLVLQAFQTFHMDGKVETRKPAGLPKGRCGCEP